MSYFLNYQVCVVLLIPFSYLLSIQFYSLKMRICFTPCVLLRITMKWEVFQFADKLLSFSVPVHLHWSHIAYIFIANILQLCIQRMMDFNPIFGSFFYTLFSFFQTILYNCQNTQDWLLYLKKI